MKNPHAVDDARRDPAELLAELLADGLASPSAGLCFCHNDPTPGNFILSPAGELRLIDWEYGGLGHREFDLAGLAVGAGLTVEQADLLLAAYWGRPPTRTETSRHRAWVALYGGIGVIDAAES